VQIETGRSRKALPGAGEIRRLPWPIRQAEVELWYVYQYVETGTLGCYPFGSLNIILGGKSEAVKAVGSTAEMDKWASWRRGVKISPILNSIEKDL
jgi:hypothetical protein